MSDLCSLSTTVEISFAVSEKRSNLSSFFFTYHSEKYFSIPYVLFFIIKVPCEDVLLSIITCRHLLLTYHTQMYFIKASYYLAKT